MPGYSDKYGFVCNEASFAAAVEDISSGLDSYKSAEAFLKCFSFMDLTTLHTNDTDSSVAKLVEKVNGLRQSYPDFPLPASICVYPNFASVVVSLRCSPQLHVTTVSACFPSSQSFPEVKIRECELAVENGAEEVDIVLSLNAFLAGDCDRAFEEISAIRKAVPGVVLKVILETGLLRSVENIAEASFLAMEAGADFIKTSTGKVDINATPLASYTMCSAIAAYHKVTGRKVGFKAAGGISTAVDALLYYAIVSSVLGEEWLCKERFRLGVSRLGNALMGAVLGGEIAYF